MNLTKDTVSVIIPFEIKRVAKSLLNVIDQGKGFKIKSKNELANSYTISTGMSATSWGEDMTIQLVEIEGSNKTQISVSSSSKTGMLGGGAITPKNQMNIDHLLNNISNDLQGLPLVLTSGSDKSIIKVLLMLLFFGWFGGHHFYLGKTMKGLLYFFTFGLFTIGVFFDFIMLCIGRMEDKNGNYITNW
jgi:TM2 domain-containing membrane protein YozV